MEKNIEVRVLVNYNDVREDMKLYTAGTIRFLDYQRARELLQKGLIAIRAVRKCKYE